MEQMIRVGLLNGSDFGPKTVKISNWSGKALYSPRANLANILKLDKFEHFDFSMPGIYILKSDATNNMYSEKIYIGQADIIRTRIKQHIADSDKDFNELLVFCGDDLHITNIKYIESRLVTMANDCKNAEIENGNNPKEPNIDLIEKATMDYFIEKIKLILPIVGYNFLKQTKVKLQINDTKNITYSLNSKGIKAQLIENTDGFVVLKDSEAVLVEMESLGSTSKNIRKRYIENKILIENKDKFIFNENITFSSLSTAASVILGTQISGPKYWKDNNGNTYEENNK